MKLKKPSKIKVSELPIFPISINVHNLMMVPEDVPNYNETVFNEYGDQLTYTSEGWKYENDYGVYDAEPPKLWYDIPQFDTDRTELEKLSKEELIEIILKERDKK